MPLDSKTILIIGGVGVGGFLLYSMSNAQASQAGQRRGLGNAGTALTDPIRSGWGLAGNLLGSGKDAFGKLFGGLTGGDLGGTIGSAAGTIKDAAEDAVDAVGDFFGL